MIKKYSDFLNESSSEKKFKVLPEGTKIFVTHAYKNVTEDSYEQGEIGKTTANDFSHGVKGKMFSSIEELADKSFLSSKHNSWSVMEDRILFSRMEDEDGNEVDEKSNLFKNFKEGKINLYSCMYEFYVKIVKTEKIEDEELAILLGAELS